MRKLLLVAVAAVLVSAPSTAWAGKLGSNSGKPTLEVKIVKDRQNSGLCTLKMTGTYLPDYEPIYIYETPYVVRDAGPWYASGGTLSVTYSLDRSYWNNSFTIYVGQGYYAPVVDADGNLVPYTVNNSCSPA